MNYVQVDDRQVVPSKVVCIGRNYAKHIAELNNIATGDLVVFMKPNASIAQSLSAFHKEPLHYEGEITFLVEKGQLAAVGFA